MATKFKLKRSAVAGKRPVVGDLQLGELGLNFYDGHLFARRETNGVGIADTVSILTPWVENFGGTAISYSNNIGVTGVSTFGGKYQISDSGISKVGAAGTFSITGQSGSHISIQAKSGEESIVAASDGSVRLYYDNSQRLETSNSGVDIVGSFSLSGSISGFDALRAPHSASTKTIIVKVISKTAAHRYFGNGSSNGYTLDDVEAPFLTLTPGRTYRFDQTDNSNSGHPFRFYLDASKTTSYSTGVTVAGNAGNSGAYTEITVSDDTPTVLHYQCSAHGFMGNSVQTSSSVSTKLATARTISLSGDLSGSTTFDGSANATISATIAANSVSLGGDTTGNYVASITGTSNEVEVTNGSGEGSTPQIGLPNAVTINTSLTVPSLLSNGQDLTIRGGGSQSTRASIVLPNSTSNALEITGNTGTTAGIDISGGAGTVKLIDGGATRLETTDSGINVGILTATTKLSTGVAGINIDGTTISGPAEMVIDPAAVGDDTGLVRIRGDLYVDGTEFKVDSTTINLADHKVGIATTVATNALLDGAGIGIGSEANEKTFLYNTASTALKSSEHIDLASGKRYKINGTGVLSANALGTGVVKSNLTEVGTLIQLNVGGGTTTGNLNVVGMTTTTQLNVAGVVTATSGGLDMSVGIATIGVLDVYNLTPDGNNSGANNQVPVADGNGGWSWQPVSAAGAGNIDGITIRDEGSIVGTANSISTIDFVGPNIIADAASLQGISTVTLSNRPTFETVNTTGIATFIQFNVGVGGTVITTTDAGNVGINSTLPAYSLDVVGDINSSTDIKVNGVSIVSSSGASLDDVVALAIALG